MVVMVMMTTMKPPAAVVHVQGHLPVRDAKAGISQTEMTMMVMVDYDDDDEL